MSAADDFAILIGWFGELDKPRHEALLASASRAVTAEDGMLVGVAVISRAEFDAAVAAARARGLAWEHGAPTLELEAYAVVVDDGGDFSHASLGFDAQTAGHLAAIADALEPGHRAPVDEVIEQVRVLVGAG